MVGRSDMKGRSDREGNCRQGGRSEWGDVMRKLVTKRFGMGLLNGYQQRNGYGTSVGENVWKK